MCISSSRDTVSGQTVAVEGGRGEEREGRGEEREGRGEERGGRGGRRERGGEERSRGIRVKEEGGKRVVVIFLARKIMIDVFNSTDNRPQFQTLLWVRQDLVQSCRDQRRWSL